MLLLFFMSTACTLCAQEVEPASFKNEVSIDASNILYLLRPEDRSYMIQYKRHLTKLTLRSGANLKLELSKTDGQRKVDLFFGLEKPFLMKRWDFHYGADLSAGHLVYNFQDNTVTTIGLSPLIGFRYYLSPRFSLAIEPKLNFLMTIYRDPSSFNKNANSEIPSIGIGSTGTVLLNFHF